MKCSLCDRPVKYLKPQPICRMHYQRWWQYGRFDTPKKNKWYKPHTNNDGYLRITIMGKRVLHHRYVMEQKLGRTLKPTEHVHHKDGNKSNNDLSNLEVLGEREHHITHQKYGGKPIDWSLYDIPKRRYGHKLWKGKVCLIKKCKQPVDSRGLCARHYQNYHSNVLKKI